MQHTVSRFIFKWYLGMFCDAIENPFLLKNRLIHYFFFY